MRARATIVVIATLAVATPAVQPAVATATPKQAKQIKRLKKQVRALKRSRNDWRQRARDAERDAAFAEDALMGPLADQVTAIARSGQISKLAPSVLEPIRVNWPCGSSLFQGETFWSVDVNLLDFDDHDCSG